MSPKARQVVSRLQTYTMVTLVTALVWVWAEAESLSSAPVNPKVEFVSATDTMVAGVTEPAVWSGTVRARMRGPTGAIDTASRVLARPLVLTPGIGSVPSATGDHMVDMRTVLADHPEIKRLGVSFSDVDPAAVKLHIEELAVLTLPVKVLLGELELEGEPKVEPASVAVRLPASAASRLGASPSVVAEPSADAIARLHDDAPQTLTNVRLTLPGTAGVKPLVIAPATATVTVNLRSRTETWEIASVPVYIVLPPNEGRRWDVVVLTEKIDAVTVTGPREVVRAIRENRESVKAYVELTGEDLLKPVEIKTAVIRGPGGGVRFEAENLNVRVRITRRGVGGP